MTVKGQWWKVQISDSVLANVHGFSRWITELHIPAASVSINIADDTIHCFKSYLERYGKGNAKKVGKAISVPDSLVLAAKAYMSSKEGLDKEVRKWFSQHEPKTPNPRPPKPDPQPTTVTRSTSSSRTYWMRSK